MALQNMSVWEASRDSSGAVTVSLLPETPHVVWSEWKRAIAPWGSSGLYLMVTDGGYVIQAGSGECAAGFHANVVAPCCTVDQQSYMVARCTWPRMFRSLARGCVWAVRR